MKKILEEGTYSSFKQVWISFIQVWYEFGWNWPSVSRGDENGNKSLKSDGQTDKQRSTGGQKA